MLHFSLVVAESGQRLHSQDELVCFIVYFKNDVIPQRYKYPGLRASQSELKKLLGREVKRLQEPTRRSVAFDSTCAWIRLLV